jgi:hypothetical protein
MSVKELKQQIYDNIELLSYKKMILIAELLSTMNENSIQSDDFDLVTDEDILEMSESKREFRDNPDSFISLTDYLSERTFTES